MRYKKVSKENRDVILREYLTSDLNCRELGEKYDVNRNTISKWVHRYLNEENVLSLQSSPKMTAEMSRKKKEDSVSADIAQLQARIRELELQNLALNTLIDVAERNGLEIRKKSGAKQ